MFCVYAIETLFAAAFLTICFCNAPNLLALVNSRFSQAIHPPHAP